MSMKRYSGGEQPVRGLKNSVGCENKFATYSATYVIRFAPFQKRLSVHEKLLIL